LAHQTFRRLPGRSTAREGALLFQGVSVLANEEHIAILKQGLPTWNQWRESNPQIWPDLSEANLDGWNLVRAHLFQTELNRATLRRANLTEANLSGADLSGANLSRAWLVGANLAGANLVGANLVGADLSEADLSGANLSRANLTRAALSSADLSEADLSEADLSGANLAVANLAVANLSGADLSGANLSGADLSGALLQGARLVGTNLEKANLRDCFILNLIITPADEPSISVDNIEFAQFVYLLLTHKKIRDVIDTITSKVVLILGRFTPERKAVLDAIRQEVRKYDLLPLLFDFDKPGSRDTHETITTLARLARFVIADITDPKSIPQELVSIVETLPSLPVQPLLQLGSKPWGMFDHIKRYPWVLPLHQYKDTKALLASLKRKVIAPAQAKAKQLQTG